MKENIFSLEKILDAPEFNTIVRQFGQRVLISCINDKGRTINIGKNEIIEFNSRQEAIQSFSSRIDSGKLTVDSFFYPALLFGAVSTLNNLDAYNKLLFIGSSLILLYCSRMVSKGIEQDMMILNKLEEE